MEYSFEAVKYDYNMPAKVLMQHKPGYRCQKRLHWHPELEIVYMIKGKLDANISGKNIRLCDGDLYFANKDELHQTSTPSEININYYIVLLLSFDFLKNYNKNIDNMYFEVNNNQTAKQNIANIIKNMVPIAENQPSYYQLSLNSDIFRIYEILLTQCIKPRKSVAPTQIGNNFDYAKKVISYITDNYKKNITLNSVASLVGLTPSYFSNYFKNATGCSLLQYLNGVRLEHALNDIIYSDVSVKESAVQNGFSNVKSFITQCKKVYGCTPVEYKTKNKQNNI